MIVVVVVVVLVHFFFVCGMKFEFLGKFWSCRRQKWGERRRKMDNNGGLNLMREVWDFK